MLDMMLGRIDFKILESEFVLFRLVNEKRC